MLDVTLLKVFHRGEDNARRMLPYVSGCDVYSIEASCCSEQMATTLEKEWKNERLKLSRTQFLKLMERDMNSVQRNEEAKRFGLKLRDYVFRAGKPIVMVERFSTEESRKLLAYMTMALTRIANATALLAEEKLDSFIVEMRKGVAVLAFVSKARDRHIGATISGIESKIRADHPELAGKDTIQLTMSLGGVHEPEKHCTIPIRVIDLSMDHKEKLLGLMPNSIRPKDYSEKDILAYGLGSFESVLRMPAGKSLFASSFDELKTVLRDNQPAVRAQMQRTRSVR